ncbi:uncharacterized protein J3R85_009734 [Psidium guajava]|nr:uncharacterized protein J3R85_009734 [Psidium guajava]
MWCLHELKKMLECMESMGHLVLPIFHGVDPREVRRWIGKFGDALRKHELRPGGMDAASQARITLYYVGSLNGWDSRDRGCKLTSTICPAYFL